jgi:perosamine synthetase
MKFFEPRITEFDMKAVSDAVGKGALATGEITKEFEDAVRQRYRYKYAVAVNSGTSALQLMLMAAGIGPGDEVIVPAYGIMCTVNAVLSAGATPVFADIDRWSYNIDPTKVAKLIGLKTAAILAVSLFGVPCEMRALQEAAGDLPVFEDAIECLGSKRGGKAIGIDADAACFGFFPNKQITTGEGGLVVTEDAALARRVMKLRQHGYGEVSSLMTPGYGFNMRMPDLNAALGLSQLSQLDQTQAMLRQAKRKLDAKFLVYHKQVTTPGDFATEFVYVIELPGSIDKVEFMAEMEAQGIPTRAYFNSLRHEPHVAMFRGDTPVADEVGARTVALPFHYKLTQEDVEKIWIAFERSI